MADSPFSTDRAPYGGVADAGPVADSAAASVPAWLAARRSRSQSVEEPPEVNEAETEIEVEFAAYTDDEEAARKEIVVSEPVLAKATDDEATPRKTIVISLPPLPPVPPPLPAIVRSGVNSETIVPELSTMAQDAPQSTEQSPSRHSNYVGQIPFRPPVIVEGLHAEPKAKVPSLREWLVTAAAKKTPLGVALCGWLALWIQQYGSAMTGILFSFGVHAITLTTLAVIMIGGNSVHRALNIFGVLADPNENAVSDIVLDSAMPLDPGKDAAPLEFPDLAQLATDNTMSFDPGDSLRGAVGGTGKESGDGGEGEAMSVPPVNVPKYAVTKGSFSAWTEPRDPEPGRLYVIIIQFRLPPNVKTYRGSDLTGMVIGTDLYKQVIKFRTTEMFPVNDGIVQIRIPVPGAAKLVRDTIRIESKLLREKQILQIEF